MASMSVVVALFFMTIAVLCSYADAADIFTYTAGSTCGDASDVTISGAFLGGDTYRCCSSGTTYSGGVKGFDYHVRAKDTGTDHQVNVRAYDGSTSNSATNRKAAGICDKGNTASSSPATLAAGILRIAFTNAKLTPAATRERITFVSKSRATTGIQIANSGTST